MNRQVTKCPDFAYNCIMKTLEENYRIFGNLMTEDKIWFDRTLTFHEICIWLQEDEKKLDSMLMDEIGICGQALMDDYRAHIPDYLKKKYGIETPNPC